MSMEEYGKKLESLGKLFQDPDTKLEKLFKECYALGLILSFKVEPAQETQIEVLTNKEHF